MAADNPVRIQYLDNLPSSFTAQRDLTTSGWAGSGWYFWDETDAYCHGPFESELIASNEMTAYAKSLDSAPAPKEV